MHQVSSWLDKIDVTQQSRPAVLALRAICAFVIDKNADNAMSYMKKLEQKSNPVWNLNMAFLLGYTGNLKHSTQ